MKIRFSPFHEKLTVISPDEGLLILFETVEKELAIQILQILADMEPDNMDELLELIISMNNRGGTWQ